MSYFINYRFVSCKSFSQLPITTTSVPLWEFRSTIISHHRMISDDFDLIFYEDSALLNDDHHTIVRNTNIIIKRVPSWMSTKKKDVKSLRTPSKFLAVPTTNYICYRCGNKGHFIQNCPTNSDKSYDYVRIRKPTGIPKSFLKPVDEEEAGMIVTDQGKMKVELRLEDWKRLRMDSVDVPEEIRCGVCENIMVNAVRSGCGHGYCEGCVVKNGKCKVCGLRIERVEDDLEMRNRIEQYLR